MTKGNRPIFCHEDYSDIDDRSCSDCQMINIPETEFTFTYTRSSGAGGQNVNKVNTKAILSWDMTSSTSINDGIKKRFQNKYARFVIDNFVVITSQRYRSQIQNAKDCVIKLYELLTTVEFPQKKRIATKPGKNAIKKRLENKKINSLKKRLRSEKF